MHAEDILAKLVSFDTVSAYSNCALIAWVEEYLDSHHVPHWRVNESTEKCSLLARIGPDVAGGIVLSGHTDVVPVKDQPWEITTPFTMTIQDGKLYGRGTSDMKGFLALALAHVPQFQRAPLQRPVWFAFSHDEEIGCLGAEPMTQALLAKNVAPQLVIVGEPTMMQVIGAHKGIISFETIITGKEGHSSTPEKGVSAIHVALELSGAIQTIMEDSRARAQAGSPFDPPYSTVNIGEISGANPLGNAGAGRNILAPVARLHWELRPLPGESVEALLAPYYAKEAELNAALKARFPECGIVTRQLTNVHGLEMHALDAPHYTLAAQLAGSNAAPAAVSYGTEACALGKVFPTVICGPGNIEQAHKSDEFITQAQFDLGKAFMARITDALLYS